MDHRESIVALRQFLSTQILGQERLIERLLIALLADGHMLVEGAPGLAKTRAIKELAEGLEAEFHRIQFTPDLLPSDITGVTIYDQKTGSWDFHAGPIFSSIVLADEINRASPRTQSALLQAMQEQHITIAGARHDLPKPFHVLATQNPLDLAGTYPLPLLLAVQDGFISLAARGSVTLGNVYDPAALPVNLGIQADPTRFLPGASPDARSNEIGRAHV
mgnify:CR=1 FL=1